MAVNVGTLTIDLKANTASFSASMEKMSALSAKTATDIQRSLQKIAVASTAAIGAFAAGLTEMIAKSLEAVDSLDKLAQSTGTTTETLSMLQYAAALSHVETEQLGTSLTKLARAEMQASTGNTALAAVFKKLGVSVEDGNKHLKDTGETYEELAVKFSKMQDGPVKTALAMQLFGKAGASQIPLLNELGANLAAVQKEAQEFGLVVGTNTAHLAAEAHDQMVRLEQILKGLGFAVLGAVLPALTQLADKLIEIAKTADIPGLAASFGNIAVTAITAFGNALEFAEKHAWALKAALEALAALQLGKILLPVIADLMAGGWEKAGAGVLSFITKATGLTRIIPIIQQFTGWLTTGIKFIGMLAEEEGILSAATYILEGAFALIGGWVGIAIAAVVALGVAIWSFRDHVVQIGDSTYKIRDIWNAAWIAMGKAFDNVKALFGGFVTAIKNLWGGFIDWLNTQTIAGPLIRMIENALGAAGRVLGHIMPQWAKDSLDQAKAERERAEAAAKKKPATAAAGPKPGLEPDVAGLGKPEKDPYQEAIDKLNLAIKTQQGYIDVLHGTPEAIAAVTASEKAEAVILELNNKLKEKGKALSADQTATIREKTAQEENLKAIQEFGKSLVEQQQKTQLATVESQALTAAYREGDEAVRQVTVSNAILGLTMGKTQDQINSMRGDLVKLTADMTAAADAKAIEDMTKSIADQQRQLQLSTAQSRALAAAWGEGDRAVREASIGNEILALTFGKTDAQVKAMQGDLAKLKAALEASADAALASEAAQQIDALQDQIANEKALTAAIFGTVDAQRAAAVQVKLDEVDKQIARTTDEATIATLTKVKQLIQDVAKAQNDRADAEAARKLESPLKVYNDENDALQKAADALQATQGGVLTYTQQINLANAQQELFNKAIDATVKGLLSLNNAKDGVKAFFLDMQKNAITSAQIIYDALHSAFTKLSDQLSTLLVGGKADFGAMFRDIGKQMMNQTIQQMMQKGLGALGKLIPALSGAAKADGSRNAPFFVNVVNQPDGGLLPGPAKTGGAQGSQGDVFGKLQGMLGGMWSRLGSLFGSMGHSLGGFFGFLSSVIPHAEGGSVSPGSAYLVGERGPEILTNASGTVLSNDNSRRLFMGGETPSVHYYTIDARGTDPVLTEQRTRQAIVAAHASAISQGVRANTERAKRMPATAAVGR